MKNFFRVASTFVVALFSISSTIAQDIPAGKVNDSVFISKNIAYNFQEIQLSELGKTRSTDQQVKEAASRMIADHTGIINELKKAAQKKNISLEKTGAEGEKPAELKEFEALQGKEFEKKWIAHMVSIYENRINELEAAAGHLTDAELKAINNKALSGIKTLRDVLVRLEYKYKD